MSDCFVYIIAHEVDGVIDGPVKIGISEDVGKRVKSLQTGHYLKLVALMTLRMPTKTIARDVERAFHALESEQRLAGEWFDLKPAKAAALLCLYFETALALNVGGNDEDIIANINDLSGLNAAKAWLASARFMGEIQ